MVSTKFCKLCLLVSGMLFLNSTSLNLTLITHRSHKKLAAPLALPNYVDDTLVTGSSSQFINNVIAYLRTRFTVKTLGRLHYFLS